MSKSKLLIGFHAVTPRLRHDARSIDEIYFEANRRDRRMQDFLKAAEAALSGSRGQLSRNRALVDALRAAVGKASLGGDARARERLQAPGQQSHIGVAQALQGACCRFCQAFTIVVNHDGRAAPGDAGVDLDLQLACREVGGKQRVGLGKGVLFSHVDQRNLLLGEQGAAHVGIAFLRQGAQLW